MVTHKIVVAIIVFLILISGCVSKSTEKNDVMPTNTRGEETSKKPMNVPAQNTENVQEPDYSELDALKSQLQMALKTGGITAEAHEEISNRIKYFEKNYPKEKIDELKAMLSLLKIGGQDEEKYVQISNETMVIEPLNKTTALDQTIVIWQYQDQKWIPTGKPPACPEPLEFQSPVDLDLATSILYPGQIRGGDFKPHGGITTSGAEKTEIRAPFDGYIVDVAHFTDEFGIHYMFDIQHPCGIMHRIGHLGNTLAPKFQAIIDTVPIRSYRDSRTTEVTPVLVEAGEIITSNSQDGNGFDWGAYDLRKENRASQNQEFRKAHRDESAQAYHALCWFDYLPKDQEELVRNLPATDGLSGKNSEYC